MGPISVFSCPFFIRLCRVFGYGVALRFVNVKQGNCIGNINEQHSELVVSTASECYL